MIAVGAGIVAVTAAARAWMVSGSWFFADDYRLLLDANGRQPDPDYLLEPFDGHLMPAARLVAWLVAEAGPLTWTTAAAIVAALAAAALAACLWMLLQLFGRRWAVVALLTVFATSAITAPALVWWAAAINQIPMQIAFFLAVGAWSRYLQSCDLRWLALTAFAVVGGLTFYEKSLLILAVLAFLAVAYYSDGSFTGRLRYLWTTYRPGLVVGTALGVGYTVAYLAWVPSPFREEGSWTAGWDAAQALVGTSLVTGALGGPWQWWETNQPLVLAAPPESATRLAWVVVVALVFGTWTKKERSGRAWALFAGYVALAVALVATSRGQLYGTLAGLEYRYLTDTAAVWILCLGLATLDMPGARVRNRLRAQPLLLPTLPPHAMAGALAVVCVGGAWSTASYVYQWHHHHAGAQYVKNLRATLAAASPGVLADAVLPSVAVPEYAEPDNRLSNFVELLDTNVTFAPVAERISMVDEDGAVRPATVNPRISALPGPNENCGWVVDGEEGETSIPLDGRAFEWTWWIKMSYLASEDTTLRVETGTETVDAQVVAGLNSLFVEVEAGFETVDLSVTSPTAAMCIDTLDVGELIPAPRTAP